LTNMDETFDLTGFFQTRQQAIEFARGLDTISQAVYQSNFHLDTALTEQFGMQKKDLFLRLLRENNISQMTTSDIKAFLTRLIDAIPRLPVLTLTIAFEPQETTLKAISEWFVLNLHKQVIFELTVDHDLIAGAKLHYNGQYADFSLKPKVTELITTIMNQSYISSNQSGTHTTQPAQTLPAQPQSVPNHLNSQATYPAAIQTG